MHAGQNLNEARVFAQAHSVRSVLCMNQRWISYFDSFKQVALRSGSPNSRKAELPSRADAPNQVLEVWIRVQRVQPGVSNEPG